MRKIITLSILSLLVKVAFTQTCGERYNQVNNAAKKTTTYYDNLIKSGIQPNYTEAFIMYPVLLRKYINPKFKDSTVVNRMDDLKKTVWCFDGLCLNNNRNFHLSKIEVMEKINSKDFASNYLRESVCALCNQYKLDSNQIKSVLDYNDTTYFNKFSLLHKVLQLKNLDFNKCISKEMYLRFKTQLIDTISKLYINTDEIKSAVRTRAQVIKDMDIFAEAVLMIALLDEQPNISDDVYDIILNSQSSVGLWQFPGDNIKLTEHTTLVSGWLLLDYNQKLKKLTIK
ncbi:MAG: hypothetical protein U0U67_15410 [Chitinophagales bacterium]